MIHPSAIVSPKAEIGQRVSIGAFTLVHDDVVIGDDVVIENHCELGHPTALAEGAPLVIGDGALIRSYSCFYAGSTIGPGLRTGHRVTVREKLVAGRGLQLGTLTDLQGHARIGDHVRMHSNVHVGQGSTIGNCVWIFPYVVLTNDPHPPSEVLRGPTIEDFAVVATMSVVLPGARIGTRALVGAHSLVKGDVPADKVVAGSPAKVVCDASSIVLRDGSGRPAYPWMRHFHRGYPPELVAEWKRLFGPFPDDEASS